jgi:hypothetical protein
MLHDVVGHSTKEVFLTGRERWSNLAIKDIERTNIDPSAGTQRHARVVSEMRWSSDEIKFVEAAVLTQVENLEQSRSTIRRGKRCDCILTQSSSFGHPDTLHTLSVTMFNSFPHFCERDRGKGTHAGPDGILGIIILLSVVEVNRFGTFGNEVLCFFVYERDHRPICI